MIQKSPRLDLIVTNFYFTEPGVHLDLLPELDALKAELYTLRGTISLGVGDLLHNCAHSQLLIAE
jgi:hypothetical protein